MPLVRRLRAKLLGAAVDGERASHIGIVVKGASVRSEVELSATVRKAMDEKKLNRAELAHALNTSEMMVDKILCGDVVPSRHLEKLMVEVLGIEAGTVDHLSESRQTKTKAEAALEEKRRQAPKRQEAA